MTKKGQALDEERRSYHVAAHAVASWKLGYGIGRLSIDLDSMMLPHGARARHFELLSVSDARGRSMVEQNAMVLLASSVAEELFEPGATTTCCTADHQQLHAEMYDVEVDGSVHIAWCNYLWQRTYALLSWPGLWKLIVALARVVRLHHTLDGRAADDYLKRLDAALQHDPDMPNAILVGEVAYVCSPWHRDWFQRCTGTKLPAKRTNLPKAVKKLLAAPDFRPLRDVLTLSKRALRGLELVGIKTGIDLSYWSPYALTSIRGLGRRSVEEIVAAAAQAGLTVAPDDAPLPWHADPKRWR